jgi:hypothetical protein
MQRVAWHVRVFSVKARIGRISLRNALPEVAIETESLSPENTRIHFLKHLYSIEAFCRTNAVKCAIWRDLMRFHAISRDFTRFHAISRDLTRFDAI